MSEKTALILIDLLAGAFGVDAPTTRDGEPVLPRARQLLERARKTGTLVVHVVEDFDEAKYPPGSTVWNAYQIHPDVAARAGEPIVRQQRYDAFCGSDLHELLSDERVSTVVICGISSAWCVDTAVRRAYGLGYRVVLAADAHGSSDVGRLPGPEVAKHHNEVLAACFAEVRPVSEIVF